MVSLLLAVETVRNELKTCEGAAHKLDITDRLITLYIALPVGQLIEFVSEAGSRSKGSA
jgi:hypothetical protein